MKARYRILIVDDEDNVRRMLTTALTLQGHETLTASHGAEALQRFTDTPPDVVLMDIRMPTMNGIDALKIMRTRRPRTPVILMTAYAEVETAIEALRSGAFDYVIKPFDLDELNLLIQRALQLQAMKQEIRSLHQALSTSWQWGAYPDQQPAHDGDLQRHRENCPFASQRTDQRREWNRQRADCPRHSLRLAPCKRPVYQDQLRRPAGVAAGKRAVRP
ncbi:Nitrogen assimilation regulatory protein [Edwardsiella tarda]|nr:Nitrogen assimilation regulatory protein [Edwardsiella tarda]